MRANARLTIVEQVTYQSEDAGMVSLAEQPHSHEIVSDERPYQRWLKVGEKWQPLDLGYVGLVNCGMLRVYNALPRRETYPTKEEAAQALAAVVELSVDGVNAFAEVPVGDSCRLRPSCAYMIRCRKGVASVGVTVVPK